MRCSDTGCRADSDSKHLCLPVEVCPHGGHSVNSETTVLGGGRVGSASNWTIVCLASTVLAATMWVCSDLSNNNL